MSLTSKEEQVHVQTLGRPWLGVPSGERSPLSKTSPDSAHPPRDSLRLGLLPQFPKTSSSFFPHVMNGSEPRCHCHTHN